MKRSGDFGRGAGDAIHIPQSAREKIREDAPLVTVQFVGAGAREGRNGASQTAIDHKAVEIGLQCIVGAKALCGAIGSCNRIDESVGVAVQKIMPQKARHIGKGAEPILTLKSMSTGEEAAEELGRLLSMENGAELSLSQCGREIEEEEIRSLHPCIKGVRTRTDGFGQLPHGCRIVGKKPFLAVLGEGHMSPKGRQRITSMIELGQSWSSSPVSRFPMMAVSCTGRICP